MKASLALLKVSFSVFLLCMPLNTAKYGGVESKVECLSQTYPRYCGKNAVCSCNSHDRVYSMNCSHKGLCRVKNGLIPVNVTDIDLTYNELQILPPDAFKNLYNLTSMNLSYNKIGILPDGLFSTNINLKRLYFIRNDITNLPQDCFWNVTKLVELKLCYNNLSNLPDGVFSKLVNLKVLYLNHNFLTHLGTDTFSSLSKLTDLKLSNNKLTVLPENCFEQNNAIAILYIDNNALQSATARVFSNLTNVTKMSLTRNNFTVLNETTFSKNRNILHLYLDRNELTDLPVNIFRNLRKLKFLRLSNNRLDCLPEEVFAGNTNITHLYIDNNRLTKLPRTIFQNLSNLQHLDLSNNEFSQIQKDLLPTTGSFEALYFSKNKISTLENLPFHGVRNIDYLFMYGNNLSFLPDGLFQNTTLSKVLDLSMNNLSSIPSGLFNKTNNSEGHGLSLLLLQKNRLTHLKNDTFNGLQKLKKLLLSNNPINIIEDNAFTGTALEHTFVHCANLSRLPSVSRGIILCVTQQENQNFTLYGNIRHRLEESFKKQGFRCKDQGDNITCVSCMLGTYGDGNGNCLPCPKGGFYQNEMGSMDYKKCNNGSFVKEGRGSSPLDCKVCPEGTSKGRTAGYRACICKHNYTRMGRFNKCTLCMLEGLNCSEDYMTILPGYYWNWSFPNTKGDAYLAFVKNLQTKSPNYPENTTQYNYSMPMVFKCLRYASCVSNDTLAIHKDGCAEGYRGWLCSKCQRKYYSVLGVCYQCPNKVTAILLLLAVLLLCVALILLIVWTNNKAVRNTRTAIDKLCARIKIVLGFYQVTGDLFESFSDVQEPVLLNIFEQLASITDFFEIIVRPQCINEHLEMSPLLRLKILLTFPVALILFTACAYFCCAVYIRVRCSVRKGRCVKDIKSRMITFMILTIFVTYTPTCNAIFTLYPAACTKYNIYSDRNQTISLLRADRDISCDSLTIYHIAAYVATLCYVISYPTLLFLMLWTHRSDSKRKNTHTETSRSGNDHAGDTRTLLGNVQRNSEDEFPIWFNFLSENYRKQFWYWEVIELARKVTQTMLVTLLGWRNVRTRLLTIGLSVLFLTINIKYSPMKNGFEHRLQVFSLTAIFLNTLVSSVRMGEEYSWIVYTGLAVIDMFILIIVAAEALIPLIKYVSRLVTRR